MLAAFFDFGNRIGWEACAVGGSALAAMLLAGLITEHIAAVRKS